jgi:DNA-binding transcriptional LysR family regulator
MEIDPRRLRVLRAVALGGGVMNAARLLHLTPSAVSQHLAQLEREVGLTLVDRSRRRVELNEAGSLLAARAERIEHELAEARRELAALSGRVSGAVVVAAFSTAIRHLLVPAIALLSQTHPDVHPRVFDLEGPPAERELRIGGIDVLITERDAGEHGPMPDGLAERVLGDDPYRVVVPTRWTIRPGSVSDLADRPWISGPPESACGQALDRLAGQHSFTPQRPHICLEFPSVLGLVTGGFGAAIVPMLALRDADPDAVAVTDISVGGARRLAAAYRVSRAGIEPVVTVTLDALSESADRLGLGGRPPQPAL